MNTPAFIAQQQYSLYEKLTEKDVVMDDDLCEECGEWKPCVIKIRKRSVFKRIIKQMLND